MILRFFYVALITACLGACGIKKEELSAQSSTALSLQNEVIIAKIGEIPKDSAPFLINSVSIEGNILTINVSYGGGCEKHLFEMRGNSMVAKSKPPIRKVELIHLSNSDKCKKQITENIKVDVSEFAYRKEAGSEIYLSINGWTEKVKYIFSSNN